MNKPIKLTIADLNNKSVIYDDNSSALASYATHVETEAVVYHYLVIGNSHGWTLHLFPCDCKLTDI